VRGQHNKVCAGVRGFNPDISSGFMKYPPFWLRRASQNLPPPFRRVILSQFFPFSTGFPDYALLAHIFHEKSGDFLLTCHDAGG
jgi:hypothetical protein